MVSEASGDRVSRTCVLDHTPGAPEKRLVGCGSAGLYFIFFGNGIKSRCTLLALGSWSYLLENLFCEVLGQCDANRGLSHACLPPHVEGAGF